MNKQNNSVIKIIFDINCYLNKKSKLNIIILLPVMFINGLLQVISITTFIPLIEIIFSRKNNNQFGFFNKLLNNISIDQFDIFTLLAIIILVFFISGIFQILSLRYITKTSAIIGNDITNKSFRKLFEVSFEQFQLLNSSNIIYTIINQTNRAVIATNSILLAANAIISLLFIITGLLLVNSEVTFFLGISIISTYLLIAKKLKSLLNKNSKLITKNANQLTQIIMNVFGLYKEYKIEDRISHEIKNFNKLDKQKRILSSVNQFYKLAPKPILEFVFIFSTLTYIIICLNFDYELNLIFSSISILLVSFPKILPSMQQIYSTWAGIEGFKSDLLSLRNHLNLKQIILYGLNDIKSFNQYKIKEIIIKDLSFSYRSNQNKFIFKDINFTISKGKIYGIFGKTGSGKSTFINLILGLMIPRAGNIFINKNPLFENNSVAMSEAENLYSQISFASSKPFIFNGSISENIVLYDHENYSKDRIKEVLEICLCLEFIDALPDGCDTTLNKDGNNFSSGQLQRISIARSLYKKPKFLILDEATNALDLSTEIKLYKNIKKYLPEITIILITHRKEIINICDKNIEFN